MPDTRYKLPTESARRLRRNLQRRRVGGVCAGIADYFGIGPTPIRLLFLLLILFTGGVMLWIYLALWLILPAKPHIPIPDVSRPLRRELKRIERRVRKAHRRLDPALADRVQETFDAVKTLAPDLDRPTAGTDGTDSLREQALSRFPEILERLLWLPSGLAGANPAREQLTRLHDRLKQAQTAAMEREISGASVDTTASAPQWIAWKSRLASLQDRLQERAGEETMAALQRIEEKLAFLATRGASADKSFDLDPYHVNKIALEYLPDAVEQYLKLPPSMARSERLPGGQTAEQALNEQLNLLDHALLDLSRSLFERNAGGLMIHGRFLRDKFADQSFRLPE